MLSACYSYATVPPSGVQVGDRVRVRVSGGQAERLEPVLGPTDRRVEGQVLDQADSSISLGISLPAATEGLMIGERPEQRIVIPRADLQEMELRRFDKLRTSLLIGGTVAVVVAIAAAKGSTLLGGSGGSGSPNESRVPRAVPLIRWTLPVP